MRLLLAMLLLATAHGQSLPGIGPRVPDAAPVESLPPVRAQGEKQEGGELIAARLERVILVKPGGAEELGRADGLAASVDLVLPAPRKLAGRLAAWLGKPLTSGGLAALADEILIHYDEGGYPVVIVEAPEQDLGKGELRLSVEIGRYGEIGVSRPKYGKPEVLQKGQLLRRGDPVRRAEIDEQLNWYGRTSFRHPRLFVSPGTEPATADLLVAFEETKPWKVTTGYENSGPDLLGKDRMLLGVVGWTPGEQLVAWQTVVGLPPSSLLANAVHWEIPFHSSHQLLQLDVAYAKVRSSYVSSGIPVDSEGSSWSLAALQKLPLPPVFGWQQSLGGGFELKGTDQFLLFGGGSLSPGEVVLFHGKLQHELSRSWESGGASFVSSFYVAPGNLSGNNDDSAFKAYDPAADSSYVFGRLSGEGWWSPAADWQLRLRGSAQVADSRLLPAEQFAAGGYQTVRGVNEREFAGDCGWQGSFEVLSPLISPVKGCDFRMLAFFDYAALESRRGGPESSLYSTGLGLRMRLLDHLDLRLDHGWRLDDAENRTHVGINFEF